MSYFKEVADYKTYAGSDADLHFSYNANSGGGQSFLGGRFYGEDGQLCSTEQLNGKTVRFRISYKTKEGEHREVIIDDDKAVYEIKPRGEGSTSMKLSVGMNRESPSRVISALFMLPPTCFAKNPNSLDISMLSTQNYWLQSMWLNSENVDGAPEEAYLVPKDFVFAGGVNKEGNLDDGKFFLLDYERRIHDILALADSEAHINADITDSVQLFADILNGVQQYSFEACSNSIKTVMTTLAREYPALYSGITDPLPILMEIASESITPATRETDQSSIDPTEQKKRFRLWLQSQSKADGTSYSENTINSYLSQMTRGYEAFDSFHDYTSPFAIQSAAMLDEYIEYLFSAPGFDEFNERAGNKACSYGFLKYKAFLEAHDSIVPQICYDTPYQSQMARNRIIFGAPGTGKSYTLNRERIELLGEGNETDYERVTFHPDYSYASFVGTYKPVPKGEAITYQYVPGPFMRVYVNALKNGRTNNVKPYLLIIEEINRANVAAVFGDVFQLLDRDGHNVSEYPIQASEDIKVYLASELGGSPEDYGKIRLPNNMFIWATMNSADQGVFPMDTAFKRRWDFTYIGINESEDKIRGKTVLMGRGAHARIVEWNSLRRSINERLSSFKINEDKLLGPYFLSQKIVPQEGEINQAEFCTAFKNKVLMYLFDDAAKQKRPSLFAEDVDTTKYSSVCTAFDEKGVFVFCSDISNRFDSDKPSFQATGDTE